MDVLNESLLAQKYILIRSSQTFRIVPADKGIDPSLVPLVNPDTIEDERGNSELVGRSELQLQTDRGRFAPRSAPCLDRSAR